MIIHERRSNNHLRPILSTTLLLATLFLAACGGSGEGQQEATNAEGSAPCAVTLDTGAWEIFRDLAARSAAGEVLPREDLRNYVRHPAVAAWQESQPARVPDIRVVNWLDSAFNPIEDPKAVKPNKDRAKFQLSYGYSQEHRGAIDEALAEFRDENLGCEVLKRAGFWLPVGQVPTRLEFVFLPSLPELRVDGDRFFVDTGVLRAGGKNQLVRQLVGLLYRDRGHLPGTPPAGHQGAAAVAHSIRAMANEGITGYIEDLPNTFFLPDHPKLGEVNIIPENVFNKGRDAVALFEQYLPDMVADPAIMRARGRDLAKTLIASSSLHQGGFCMASCIAAHEGEEALRDAARHPSAFLAAYQQAALQNPDPAPEPYLVSGKMHTSMPPFDEAVLADLIRICDEVFGPQP